MHKIMFVLYFLIVISIHSCVKSPLAKVNDLAIYPEDLKDEKGIQHAYGADYCDEEILLLIFQKKLREYVLLNKLEIKIISEMLEKEKERIDMETKAPDILYKVKEYFQGDEERYIKKYVYPVLISRLFENTFYYDTIIQRKSYILARKKFKELKENPSMEIKDNSLYISLDLEEIENKYDNKFPFILPHGDLY